ncbi:C-type lectin domain family 2 member D-like [Protobothrops mucrosquamatus]|uniref:C-type lectin domain family 2 member D-like n=1 Tax=Protobothrops mucrosquamatus TaxID=103944 RepID=UPI000775C089|nr:C-type lectin domain family 2 member D-like [Protobothrops mucrosquamatus]
MGNCFIENHGYIVTMVVAALGSSVLTALVCFIVYETTLKTDDCKLLSAPSQHGKRPCPPDWIGHQMKCFYFSDEEKNWTASQEFCSLHNASLAIIEKEERDFVQRYKGSTPHWIGFKRDPDQDWKWINGNASTLTVLGNGGNCAFLNDEGKASSSMCRTVHHWICSKPDEFTSPKIA